MPDAISAAATVAPQEDQNLLTAEEVAGVVSGIPTIGQACDALRKAGWSASIAGNRITVNHPGRARAYDGDEVFALFIGGRGGPLGDLGARWMIYTITGTPPILTSANASVAARSLGNHPSTA